MTLIHFARANRALFGKKYLNLHISYASRTDLVLQPPSLLLLAGS